MEARGWGGWGDNGDPGLGMLETGGPRSLGRSRDQGGQGGLRDRGDHGQCRSVPTARALLASPTDENNRTVEAQELRWEESDPDAAPDAPTAGGRVLAGSDRSHHKAAPALHAQARLDPGSSDVIRKSLSNLGLCRVWVLEPRDPGGPDSPLGPAR